MRRGRWASERRTRQRRWGSAQQSLPRTIRGAHGCQCEAAQLHLLHRRRRDGGPVGHSLDFSAGAAHAHASSVPPAARRPLGHPAHARRVRPRAQHRQRRRPRVQRSGRSPARGALIGRLPCGESSSAERAGQHSATSAALRVRFATSRDASEFASRFIRCRRTYRRTVIVVRRTADGGARRGSSVRAGRAAAHARATHAVVRLAHTSAL
jgi:hypothetical protein